MPFRNSHFLLISDRYSVPPPHGNDTFTPPPRLLPSHLRLKQHAFLGAVEWHRATGSAPLRRQCMGSRRSSREMVVARRVGALRGERVNRPLQVRRWELLGTASAQTAPAATSTAPEHQRRLSANAETTPAGAPAAAADRTQRPDATCEGKNG